MKRFGLGLALVCLALSAATVSAQEKYPTRPVKIVVPYAPGGATDITARLFGEQMRQSLGQQFVIESKPGAFGILAIEEMARSKPDGYAYGRQRDDQCHYASPLPEETLDQFRERGGVRFPACHLSVLSPHHHA
jgi:tripartite-type tricarboxylate transporter receptor subunit TctC